MVRLTDVYSLTEFQRNAKMHLRQMKKTRRPHVLTVNGKAEAVVQDAASYQKVLEAIDRAEAIEGIRRGLEDLKAGRAKPAEQVFAEMRRRFKIPRRR